MALFTTPQPKYPVTAHSVKRAAVYHSLPAAESAGYGCPALCFFKILMMQTIIQTRKNSEQTASTGRWLLLPPYRQSARRWYHAIPYTARKTGWHIADSKIWILVRSLSFANIRQLIQDDESHKDQIPVSGIHQPMAAAVRCKRYIAGFYRAHRSIVIIVALTR